MVAFPGWKCNQNFGLRNDHFYYRWLKQAHTILKYSVVSITNSFTYTCISLWQNIVENSLMFKYYASLSWTWQWHACIQTSQFQGTFGHFLLYSLNTKGKSYGLCISMQESCNLHDGVKITNIYCDYIKLKLSLSCWMR